MSKTLPQPFLSVSPFLFLPCSPGSRIVPATGTVPPFHCITAPVFCQPATDPISMATNQLVPPGNLPTPQPSQRRSLLRQTRRPSLPAAVLSLQQ
ncbi:MAG: hypothetical protein H6577_12835 [Lewinellaceae bacterium]|nr:hypothetical protein [Lewinellaceae bacterium]